MRPPTRLSAVAHSDLRRAVGVNLLLNCLDEANGGPSPHGWESGPSFQHAQCHVKPTECRRHFEGPSSPRRDEDRRSSWCDRFGVPEFFLASSRYAPSDQHLFPFGHGGCLWLKLCCRCFVSVCACCFNEARNPVCSDGTQEEIII